ncbi:hypothetical protein ACSQ67_020378 [Phaseolus vulgaris]
MGTVYSRSRQTNLLGQSTTFQASSSGTKAQMGDNFEVSMATWKGGKDTNVWCVQYITSETKKRTCRFILEASRENKSVKSISFMLSDEFDNDVKLVLDIKRVGRDRLHGGITASRYSGVGSFRPMLFEREVQDLCIETHVTPYGWSQRGGLVVLEKKKLLYSHDAFMVTVAHYYIRDEIGVSVAAKVRRSRDHGFVVEVEGPFVHPGADLFKVVEQTCRSGVWSPGACSHCNNGASSGNGSSLSDKQISEILKRLPSFGSVGDQFTGIINAAGYTNGFLNNCVILIDFK